MIRLITLGAIDIRSADGATIRAILAQPKRFALLACLALTTRRGTQRRDTLLGLFWPEFDESRARAALSQAIYQLRRHLGTNAIWSRGRESLAVSRDAVWCDAVAFHDAMDRQDDVQALDLYRGEFLPGFFLSGTPEWGDWVETERARLRERAASAAWRLFDVEAELGSAQGAIRWGQRALDVAPLDEPHVRRMIELQDRAGDRAGALRTYEIAERHMSLAFEIEPSPETIEVVRAVRQRDGLPADRKDSHALYVKGRHFLTRMDADSFHLARQCMERAIDLAPDYALAWSGLAEAYGQLADLGVLPGSDAYPRAVAAAQRAIDLDPSLAEAHAVLGNALSWYYWRDDEAESCFQRAIELEPRAAKTRRLYATHLRNSGAFERALDEIRQAQALDPLFAFAHVEEGIILYLARRYPEAVVRLERFLRVHPEHAHARLFIAMAHAESNRFEEALAELRRVDADSTHPDALGIRGYIEGRMGEHGQARQTLARLQQLERHVPVSSFQKAAIHVGLGEDDLALSLLERAVEEPTWHVRLLDVTPVFDQLRPHARFAALIRTIRNGRAGDSPSAGTRRAAL